MGRPVVHFHLDALDSKNSKVFYSKLFGWKFKAVPKMAALHISTGTKKGISAGVSQVPEGSKAGVAVYVDVKDVQKALTEAEKLGATIVQGPTQLLPDLITGIFKDAEGRSIGLIHKIDKKTLRKRKKEEKKSRKKEVKKKKSELKDASKAVKAQKKAEIKKKKKIVIT